LSMAPFAASAQSQNAPPPPPPPPDQNAQPEQAPGTEAQGQPAATDASQAVSNYNEQARGLISQPADPTHPAEIKALRSLADAIDALPGGTDDVKHSTANIRNDADTLEKSPVTDVHSDTTKDALSTAVGALNMFPIKNPPPEMTDKISAARDAVEK